MVEIFQMAFKDNMKNFVLLLIFFIPSMSYATQINYGTIWQQNGQVTSANLNGNFANVSSVVNGKLDNTNADTTDGYRFYQTVTMLPSPGNQGSVYFLTTDNSLNFDTGSSFSKSVSVISPLANQVPVYSGSVWVPTTISTLPGTVPIGGIIMWSGSIASIPSGYQLCNGTNGTPDLRNRFIVGADADVTGTAESTVTGSALQISEGQLPSTTLQTFTATKFFSATSPAFSIGGDGMNNSLTYIPSFGTGTANVARFYALAFIERLS